MIENAKIRSTNLGAVWTGHGIMSYCINCEGDGWGQGFGMHTLDDPVKDADGNFLRREGTVFGMECVRRILEVVECDWEQLPGKHIRVQKDGFGSPITRIGHILKDKWFDPEALREEYYE